MPKMSFCQSLSRSGAVQMKIRKIAVVIIGGLISILCTSCTKIGTDDSAKKAHIVISDSLMESDTDMNEGDKDVKVYTLSDSDYKEKDVATKSSITAGYQKIQSKGKVKMYNSGVAVIGDTAYEQYNYVESASKKYIDTVNKISKKFEEKVNVYEMIIPTSIAITLPDDKYDKVDSSNQKDAVNKMYKRLSDRIMPVDIFDELMKHRKEYIYFRTDHHWTARGAYYAYKVFCETKGIVPNNIESYKTDSFGKFKGSFYRETDDNVHLKADRLDALYPIDNDNISTEYTENSGEVKSGHIIEDASSYAENLKYCSFIDGDNPYTVITNKKIKAGSSCMVLKESFGNAFVPFLADHYSKIYVIDYRYWQGNIAKLAKKKNVDDVIFCNNISMTRNAYLIGKLMQLVED